MNDAAITDLKLFITQAIARQSVVLRKEMRRMEMRLTAKIDDLATGVADAFESRSNDDEAQFNNHEQRITQLEANTTPAS